MTIPRMISTSIPPMIHCYSTISKGHARDSDPMVALHHRFPNLEKKPRYSYPWKLWEFYISFSLCLFKVIFQSCFILQGTGWIIEKIARRTRHMVQRPWKHVLRSYISSSCGRSMRKLLALSHGNGYWHQNEFDCQVTRGILIEVL